MTDKRASGVLMHISSLPGNTGIGTMGKSAYDFVDFLKSAKQRYWQILPVCPTSYGDSPYQSFSTFAGNPYFIDLDMVCEDGYLKKQDYDSINWGEDEKSVDYGLLYIERHKVFKKIQQNFIKNPPNDYNAFCDENSFWLDDFALFMAIKDEHDGVQMSKWENEIRRYDKSIVQMWRVKCSERVQYYKMLQYFFYKQWFKLKSYANKHGIYIVGDLPIYVSGDSADVWANPKLFDLDENNMPNEVAGCPPDVFSEDGQLWGNPVYNWRYHKRTKYKWWIKRIEMSLKFYDVVRIDHFRGFESYYCIKADAKTAKKGVWRKGPAMDLWNMVNKKLKNVPIIAEDLGFLTDGVRKLLKDSGFPGMKILQFAFDADEESDYLPHNYEKNTVVYTGTHDNDTILGWIMSADDESLEYAKDYLRANDNNLAECMMISAMQSPANTCILTMQDLIGLGTQARMNIPSTVGENWKWRVTKDQITSEIAEWLRRYTEIYCRCKKPVIVKGKNENEQSKE